MRILTVVHQPDAGPGVFAGPLATGGYELVEWAPSDSPPPVGAFDAALVLGGGMHPDQEREHPWLHGEKALLRGLLSEGTPVLGVCLGAELLAEVAGAPPRRMAAPEVGWNAVGLTPAGRNDPVLGGVPEPLRAFEWHSFETPLPDGATALALDGDRVEAFRLGEAWAIQFHAEVTQEIVDGWIERYREDADLVAAGLDPSPLLAETGIHINRSNEVGAELCSRFLEHAAAVAGKPG